MSEAGQCGGGTEAGIVLKGRCRAARPDQPQLRTGSRTLRRSHPLGLCQSFPSWVINALLDGGERGSYGDNLFRAEVVNHSGMGVEPHQFVLFFAALADTLKDLLAADWTPAIETAWRDKLEVLDALVRNPA